MTFPAFHNCLLKIRPRLLKLFVVIPGTLLVLFAKSQKFPVSEIPDSLKENANVVVRLEERRYEIKSMGEVVEHDRHVYTILNEKGEEAATCRTFYNDKSVIINSVNAYMYDASGKEIRHFKKKDMEDHPAFDGFTFVGDERYKVGSFYSHSYPYTVDFEEEDEIHELFHVTDWFPQSNIKYSVERSSYSITAPSDYLLRYKMLNSQLKPSIVEKSNRKAYSWEIQNLIAYEDVPYSGDYLLYGPYLMIGLSDIELGGYKGKMSSWNEYAKFYGSLQKGRDILPEETKQKVHELVKGLNDPQSKVAVLYNYLQQNTHYVGIQLGIGGWQTFDATYVATKKYGDCKALSNFMISLLKEVGIKANAVVIEAGKQRRDFVTDFTHDPFDHVICCVPFEKDTIWLECTSQSLPPGYLSKFTANRYGLFIDDNGGSLVHTPAYLLPDNLQIRKISAVLDSEGNLNMECNTLYRAICQDNIESMIHHYSREEQLSELKSKFNLPTYDVTSLSYKEDYSKRIPAITESLQLSVKDYAQVTGRRIFINPDILTRSTEKLSEDNKRLFDVEFKEEYRYVDSIQIAIPLGYEVEARSEDPELKSKYGSYKSKLIVSAGKIMYYRVQEQYSGRFPAKDYNEVVKFYNDMYDADRKMIVLVKKN